MATKQPLESSSHANGDVDLAGGLQSLRLNIVIMFMGSRGDLQPALAVAKILQRRFGHRVRVACHPPYRAAVEAAGIGFYGIGGCDIKAMMERRLLPSAEVRKVVPVIKDEFIEMGERWWGACVGDAAGLDDEPKGLKGRDVGLGEDGDGFVADCILSTMHVYSQTSAAARLGVPLHLFGMNPRIYSKELPHSQAGWAVGGGQWKNVLSWCFQDLLFNQTMKSVINNTRINMGLEEMSPLWWISQYNRLNVPCTYLWSPRLLPKPSDWVDNVRVSGFVFDEVPEDYSPPADLVAFLEAEPTPPVYIGFGSMSFVRAQETFEMIFEAVRQVGVRAVVCKGWSNLVKEAMLDRKDLLVIDDAPHAWLFPRVRAVVCHGGSGTTAMALRCGKPTLVVPVAGDQPFWSSRIHEVGCGPEATFGITGITTEGFKGRLEELLRPMYQEAAERFAAGVGAERAGEEVCAEDVMGSLRVYERARCDVFGGRPAVWKLAGGIKLSAVAAWVLVQGGRVRREELRPAEVVKWPDLVSPGDPVTGLLLGVSNAIGRVIGDGKNGNLGKMLLQVLRAPFAILAAVLFGVFNLLDTLLYRLGSPFTPKLFASNPRLYSYPQMLGFLLTQPLVELGSVVAQPLALARRDRGTFRVTLEVLLAAIRTLLALLNVLPGIFGITLRHVDIFLARMLGERPRIDVVAVARLRQGRIEAEELDVSRAEEGSSFRDEIVRIWDAKRKKV
ncbi:Sterol 3-beta-glucosyltransferase UGT80B1 [Colletotrichum spinosum]|uniref:Sterol 3-beta-glucosyltransferase UGT80B1 n=1 Tax=Colletotrichum spinosum TaxID=1347390 RepID=A0A4V3HRG2_9PEZI|nr:Sterol 3-beta-glucosyltransferase UGT80B1 [Colletotrichum spinosum]